MNKYEWFWLNNKFKLDSDTIFWIWAKLVLVPPTPLYALCCKKIILTEIINFAAYFYIPMQSDAMRCWNLVAAVSSNLIVLFFIRSSSPLSLSSLYLDHYSMNEWILIIYHGWIKIFLWLIYHGRKGYLHFSDPYCYRYTDVHENTLLVYLTVM
jgi:hypothetical protein